MAKLRAEVELLELEHDADKADLSAGLKEERQTDSDSEQAAKAQEAVDQVTMMVARLGKLDEFKKEFGDEKSLQAQEKKAWKERARKLRMECDRKKKAFVARTLELNEKRLELDEVETRYKDAR